MNKNLILLFVISLMLCGCQKAPAEDVVISKNDGSFDIAVAETSSKNNDYESDHQIVYDDLFTSTDQSVDFTFHINQELNTANMPVVQVEPHFLTGQDAKRAAEAIYGENAEFWEAEPVMDVQYSKEEIQQQIARWSPYTTPEKIAGLYGSVGNPEGDAEMIRNAIENLSVNTYPNAPEGNFRLPCQWKFFDDIHYFYGEENEAEYSADIENQEIQAWTKVGDYFYDFQITTRNKNDFKLNQIYASPVYESPLSIDFELLKAEKLRTDYPTDVQIEETVRKAEAILENMELGDWYVARVKVETFQDGDAKEFTVHIEALPVFENVPVISRPQLNNLSSKASYASNYYLTEAKFSFSANGDLIDFSLASPVDVVNVVNENVSTIPVEDLLEKAKGHLSLSDYYAYGFGSSADTLSEPVLCRIEVCELEYGLTRVKVPDTDESYYYLPALFLRGNVEYVGKTTGSVYYSSESVLNGTQLLLIMNAVDGTIINAFNE